MPKPDIAPVEPISPPAEVWRDFAEQIGGGEWYRAHNISGVCHVHIFGELNFGPHWKQLGDEIGDSQDIRLTINSPGRDSIFALTFFDAYAGRVTETKILGRCYSAALTIALAGKKVLMHRKAKLLLHAPHSFCYAAAGEMAATATRLAKTTKRIFDILKLKTELSDEVIEGWLNGADCYFSAEQAAAFGIVDEIFDSPPAVSPASVAPASSVAQEQPAPDMTERMGQEQFVFDLLHAVIKDGKIQVRSKKNFERDLISFAQNLTTEEKI